MKIKKEKNIEKADKNIWFVKNGFLCIPSNWKGWCVFLAYAVLMFFGFYLMDHEAMKNVFFMIIFTIVFLWILRKKGEKRIWVVPRWKGF